MKRYPWLMLGAASWLSISPIFRDDLLIVLRPQILLFFLIGIGLRVHRVRLDVVDIWIKLALAAYLLLAGLRITVELGLHGTEAYPSVTVLSVLDNLLRLPAAIVLWWLAGQLMRSKARSAFIFLEKYTFLLFCSHVIVLKCLSVVGSRIFGSYHSDVYWMYFFLQPLLALGATVALSEVIGRLGPALLKPLNAGRMPPLVSGNVGSTHL